MSQSNSILDSLEWQSSKGALTYEDVRYMLIRPDTLIGLQRFVEAAIGPEACAEAMMASGYRGGSLSSRRYKELFNYSDHEIVAFMCQMGCEIGWGKFGLLELDPARKRLVIEVADSPIAEAYARDLLRASKHPVCHLLRGVLAGMAVGIFGDHVASEEVECVAMGDPVCRFVVHG